MRTRATSASMTSSRSGPRARTAAGGRSCGVPRASSGGTDACWSVRALGDRRRCAPWRGPVLLGGARGGAAASPCIDLGPSDVLAALPISTDSSSRGCAPASRTTGSEQGPDCWTSSPRSSVCPNALFASIFRTLQIDPVPLALHGWRLVLLDSGERHENASSGYNERRAECARACDLLGVGSLREATAGAVARLPEPLRLREPRGGRKRSGARDRGRTAGRRPGGRRRPPQRFARERDRYEVSTPAVETAVERLLAAGAAGARVVGGGFGGSVLGLFAPDVPPPAGVREVRPWAGAPICWRHRRRPGPTVRGAGPGMLAAKRRGGCLGNVAGEKAAVSATVKVGDQTLQAGTTRLGSCPAKVAGNRAPPVPSLLRPGA